MHREHRRELKHDRFVDEVGVLTSKARENQRFLITITATLVLLALIGYGLYFYRSNRERQGQDALAAAIEAIDSPLIQPGTVNPQAKFKTDDERNSSCERMFRDIQAKYSGTSAADVSNLYLARIAAGKNDVAGARKMLEAFVSEHPKHILVGAAKYSLYQIRIQNGDAPRVILELNAELTKAKDQALPPDAILSLLSRAYDAQGNADQSKEALRKIIRQYPDSPYALEAQRRVGTATT